MTRNLHYRQGHDQYHLDLMSLLLMKNDLWTSADLHHAEQEQEECTLILIPLSTAKPLSQLLRTTRSKRYSRTKQLPHREPKRFQRRRARPRQGRIPTNSQVRLASHPLTPIQC